MLPPGSSESQQFGRLGLRGHPQFNLTVTVTDSGNPAKSASAVVTVSLNNLNETPVVTPKQLRTPENGANGAFIGTVPTTDPDAGQSKTFKITLWKYEQRICHQFIEWHFDHQ